MTETEYREKTGSDKLPRLSRREVDLIASGYEWTCPACGKLNHEIAVPQLDEDMVHQGTIICTCGKRFRANTPEHAYG
jgi:transcription elongation factor Elf1